MDNNNNITAEELNKRNEIIRKIRDYYSSRIVGQKNLQISLLTCLLANGHILLQIEKRYDICNHI